MYGPFVLLSLGSLLFVSPFVCYPEPLFRGPFYLFTDAKILPIFHPDKLSAKKEAPRCPFVDLCQKMAENGDTV